MRLGLSASLLTLLLLIEQLLPPLPQFPGVASSMALGTSLAAALILLVCWISSALAGKGALRSSLDFILEPFLVVLLVIAIILGHAVCADFIQPIDFGRCAASLGPLALMLLAAMTFGYRLRFCRDESVNLATKASFWTLSAIVLLSIVRLEPRMDVYPKATFPFTETSHFALAFVPILMYRCVRATRRAAFWLLVAGLAVAMLVQSLSMIIGCLLIAMATKRLLMILGAGSLVLISGLPLELQYFTDRLNLGGDTINLSTLVYIQGWEQLRDALVRSSGWGLGFQQLGVHQVDVTAADTIRQMTGGVDLNALDGSFVLSKLGGEFGIVGILVVALYVVFAARCLGVLRAHRSGAVETLCCCIVVSFAVDMFARGPGYFVQSTMLFVVAASALLANSRRSIVIGWVLRRRSEFAI